MSPSKVIKENVQHYYGQRLYNFPVLQHFTHMRTRPDCLWKHHGNSWKPHWTSWNLIKTSWNFMKISWKINCRTNKYSSFTGKKPFVNIMSPSKAKKENVQHYYGQRLHVFPVLQHFTHMYLFDYNAVKVPWYIWQKYLFSKETQTSSLNIDDPLGFNTFFSCFDIIKV